MLRWLCINFLILIASTAFAVKVPDLYIAEITVVSQASGVRTKATQQGLIQVLTKLTSNPEISLNPTIKSSLKRAEYFVQSYNYLTSPNSAAYLLKIYFNSDDINRLLKKALEPVWSKDRPLILFVAAKLKPNNEIEIIDTDTSFALMNKIKKQALKYGLPIIFPMMDVSEVEEINPKDILELNLASLKKIELKYRADGLLIGVISNLKIPLESRWLLAIGPDQWQWNLTGKNFDILSTEIVDLMRNALLQRYTSKAISRTEWFKIKVSNVKARTEFRKLLNFLNSHSLVANVELSEVKGEVIELLLEIKGNLMNFLKDDSINQHLKLKSNNENHHYLIYEWLSVR